MAKTQLIKEIFTQTGAHGKSDGSVDNIDRFVDEIVDRCITAAQAEFKDKKIKTRINEAITGYFGPKSTRR